MKNSNDTIGNRTRDLPARSAVPQPTALPRALVWFVFFNNSNNCIKYYWALKSFTSIIIKNYIENHITLKDKDKPVSADTLQ
jgi:hypothetical protein